MSGKDAEPVGYRMADIYIDVGTRQVRRGDTVLQLPGLTFDLLLALVRRAPNVVTSGELMNEVWAGRVVNDETVAKRVELVRAALGDDSREARYIAVVRGRGYRVIAAVEAVNERAPLLPNPRQLLLRSARAACCPSHSQRCWSPRPQAPGGCGRVRRRNLRRTQPLRMRRARRWPSCRWTICPPATRASTSPTACTMR